ncbi:MAG: VCBS repeat-containing protein [Candidatus Midichloria sp.]|nr:VCBS repeat-containing protein [Candidatus Midichloria sp.]
MELFLPATTFGVGSYPSRLLNADFNHDTHLDIVTSNYGANTISVLLGNGDGTFKAPLSYNIGAGPYVGIVAGDFDGDNKYDIAMTSLIGVSILIGNGNGTLQAPMSYSAAEIVSDPFASGLTIGDFNKDGKFQDSCHC